MSATAVTAFMSVMRVSTEDVQIAAVSVTKSETNETKEEGTTLLSFVEETIERNYY